MISACCKQQSHRYNCYINFFVNHDSSMEELSLTNLISDRNIDLLSFDKVQASVYESHEEEDEFFDSEDASEISEDACGKPVHPPARGLVVTPCVIIDDDNEERTVRRCNRTHGARSVYQLSGT